MHLFFDDSLTNNLIKHSIEGDEAWHCIKVLRLKINDKITLTDGRGFLYNALVSSINQKKKILEVEILEVKEKQKYPTANLHIAIAPTKNIDRFEYFVEKATEIGVNEITPIITDNSERKTVNIERVSKILVSAIKQSGQFYLPTLNNVIHFNKFIEMNHCENKFIAHCNDTEKKSLNDYVKKGQDSLILIGPEGDFSKEEIAISIKKDFKALSLGNTRLRTETAGVVACHSFNLINL